MNIDTVNELIQSLESAGELSIKERKYLELAKVYADKEAESVAQALTFEKCRELSGCPSGVDLQDWVKKLAAENVALKGMHHYSGLSPKRSKDAMLDMKRPFIDELIYSAEFYSVCGHISASLNRAISAVHGDYSWLPETPATDRIVAEAEARGVEKFAAKLRIPGDDQFFDAVAEGVAGAADAFAKQLREGADK
ncbi:TPA: hypothetical protein MEA92_000686 [Klebsiella aerogenes]|nr:hypothetical protein [Klebsiella aerogenes]